MGYSVLWCSLLKFVCLVDTSFPPFYFPMVAEFFSFSVLFLFPLGWLLDRSFVSRRWCYRSSGFSPAHRSWPVSWAHFLSTGASSCFAPRLGLCTRCTNHRVGSCEFSTWGFGGPCGLSGVSRCGVHRSSWWTPQRMCAFNVFDIPTCLFPSLLLLLPVLGGPPPVLWVLL